MTEKVGSIGGRKSSTSGEKVKRVKGFFKTLDVGRDYQPDTVLNLIGDRTD